MKIASDVAAAIQTALDEMVTEIVADGDPDMTPEVARSLYGDVVPDRDSPESRLWLASTLELARPFRASVGLNPDEIVDIYNDISVHADDLAERATDVTAELTMSRAARALRIAARALAREIQKAVR